MPKLPNVRRLYSFALSLENVGDEVDFLPAEHESFLQVDSIIFDVHSQPCPNYPK